MFVTQFCCVGSKNSHCSVGQATRESSNRSCHWMTGGFFINAIFLPVIHPFLSLPGASCRMKSYMLLWFLWAIYIYATIIVQAKWSATYTRNRLTQATIHCSTSRQKPFLQTCPVDHFSSLSVLHLIFFSFSSFQLCSSHSKTAHCAQFCSSLLLVVSFLRSTHLQHFSINVCLYFFLTQHFLLKYFPAVLIPCSYSFFYQTSTSFW